MVDNKENLYIVSLSDTGSKFKLLFNIFILCINIIRIVPHIIIFLLHSKRNKVLSDTVTKKNLILSLIFVKHYRNLFYYRIGNIKHLIKWMLPEEKSIHVPLSLQLGESAQFVHNISSFLNAKSIGNSFVCYHHVTLGANRLGNNEKPTIGDNVTICTGAVVVGGITIGNNVIIGANAVIVKDVPSDSTVIGNPAKITRLKGRQVDIIL